MFIGEYQHAVDEKGRLAVPAKFRARLAKGAVVTRGLDNCLWLFPLSAWQELAQKIAKLPLSQANTRAFSRLMLAGAMDVKLDKQGRVVVPDYLQHYAGFQKNVVVAGLYDRLEMWDEAAWQAYKTRTEQNSGDIAEALGALGV